MHEENINAIADAGVTLGCTSDGLFYCPADKVRRDQMASFLARAIPLAPIAVPARPTTPEGDRLNLITATVTCSDPDNIMCSGTMDSSADTAFYIQHGFAIDTLDELAGLKDNSAVELAIDGAILPLVVFYEDDVGDEIDPDMWDPADGRLNKGYLFVVPAGLSGVHTIRIQWTEDGVLVLIHDLVVTFG